ncbi:peptide ABC transporter substrate-binding protein [Agrobacterium tumefaciens]|uniref:peptide ABC transporter substrate-binding protein n=1 Tax=Agrobacterium tumefaciens TaxID=358 RepID=UPI001F2CE0C3|nr:peptide ABC transporter substrate-binding protein [Agrobacterium tumefaciens]
MTEKKMNTAGPSTVNETGISRRNLLVLGGSGLVATALGPRLNLVGSARAATPPQSPKGQVVIGMSQEPTKFNPLSPHIEVDEAIYYQIYSSLWRADPKGDFLPDLAAEMPTVANGGISADGTQWRVKLRKDVKWHDGTPFTAEDVKFNLDLINDPKFTASSRAGHKLVKDVTVVSPSELTWRMDRAFTPYMSILARTFFIPKHLLEKELDLNNTKFVTAPVGTGPFQWEERLAGDHISLKANPDYHGEGPYLERLIVKYIPDVTAMYVQFQTGGIQYVGLQGISADRYAEAKTLPDKTIVPAPLSMIEVISFNLGIPIFKDPAVRQALYLALDKQSIIDALYYGLPKPTESFLPQESWAFNPDLQQHSYDLEKAQKTLEDAGWKMGGDGVREKDGLRLEFSCSTTVGNSLREQMQQLLQQSWQQIGVKVVIKNMPAAMLWGDYYTLSQFDTVIAGIPFSNSGDPDVTDSFSGDYIPAKTGTGHNSFQYQNPDVDPLLASSVSETDREKRKAAYFRIQEIIRNDLPYLPVFQYVMINGISATLQGYAANTNMKENCWNANLWFWE